MLGAMPRWAVVVLATAVALSLAGPVVAADLYVNNNYQGERSGPLGSETNPYGTIDEALDAASDGDTIRIVATGLAYAQGTLEISKQLSLVGHDGMPWIQNSGNSYTMDIYAQNVTLDNLEVDGNGTNSSHIRVAKWADGDNFTLKNCWVHGGNYNGVDLRGIDYPLSNVLIENNIIEDFLGNSDSHGIVTDGDIDGLTIRYNDINDCSGDCIQLTPYAAGYASNVTVYGNRMYRTHNDNSWYDDLGVQVPENAIDIKEVYDLTIEKNLMHGFRATNTSSPAAILLRIRTGAEAGSLITIADNIFYDNENAITVDTVADASVTCEDVVIRRNTIFDIVDTGGDVRKGRGISAGEVIDLTCAHNTIDGGQRSSLYFLPDTGKNVTDFLCYNNLFANTDRVVDKGNDIIGTVVITNNGYFNTNADPWTSEGESESNPTTGSDGDGIFDDRANRDYSLVDLADPAVDAVDKGSTAYGEPYNGSAPDLGPHELGTDDESPWANAGPDQHSTSSSVTLDGSESFDIDGSITSWVWAEAGQQIASGQTPTVSLSDGTHFIELTVTDNDGKTDTDTVVVTVSLKDVADGETAVAGTVTGTYVDTQTSNDVYEAIEEVESGGKPTNRYSYLEHKWTIDVRGGNTVTFYLEAYKTASSDGDDFVFAYSTDDVNYTDMVTVTKTSDDDAYQTFSLPSSLSGTVYIRVRDTDQTPGNRSLDTIYVDDMYILSEGTAQPTVQFDLTSSSGDESATPASLTVSLSQSSDQTVTVDYAVTGGTATGGGVDYTLADGTLSFDPGVTSQSIDIDIVDDSQEESDETIEVTLSNPVNATLGSNTVHTYTILDNDGPGGADDVADGETAVAGTVTGTYVDTQTSNDVYEAIEEVETTGKPSNRYSYLEHKWTIDVTGGSTVTFYLEAYKTASSDGDDFVFAYSTDDANYTDMVTVTKTSDDDAYQTFSLPSSLSGVVYIRVRDTDQTPGNRSLDTIYVDHMFIRSE